MAKFCTKCGASLADNSAFCTSCGQVLEVTQAQPETPAGGKSIIDNINMDNIKNLKNNPKFNTYVGMGIVGILALIVLIIFISLVSGGGYKKPLDNYFKGVEKGQGKYIQKAFSKDLLKLMEEGFDDEDVDMDDYFDDIADTFNDLLEEDYGKIKSISYKITDKKKLSDKKLKAIKDDLKDTYDTSKIKVTKGYKLEIDVKVKGKDDKDTEDIELTVAKVNGDWTLISPSKINLSDFY